jgi:hypothetical protein
VACVVPPAPGDSARPRRWSGASARRLNFTGRRRMKLWQRVVLAILAAAAAYALWRFPTTGIATTVIGACAAWLGRAVYRSKLAKNPTGENRDYSLRPVAAAAAKGLASLGAALLWAVLTAYTVRRGYVPDTWFGAGVLLAPALILLLLAAIYLLKAVLRFQFGGEKHPGG